jgi:NADH-quinone oxidoreductase subunit J
MPLVIFIILALVCIVSALMVISNPNPVRSALFLVLTFLCMAVFYITLSAQFIAAVQIIVYAGAIMVLFLFVIMLLNLGAPEALKERGRLQPRVAVFLGVLFIGILSVSTLFVKMPTSAAHPEIYQDMGTVEAVGKSLYSPAQPWLFPFEITSILLLVAVIGAIIMAKRRI